MDAVKYPRTPHLSSSRSLSSDDRRMDPADEAFLASGVEVVVTEKMDGGNLTFMNEHFYARSLDSAAHSWDYWAKGLWAAVRHQIPSDWRISGESLHAARSVSYGSLESFFLAFGVWDETNTLLGWDDTIDVLGEIGLTPVPVLYRGTDWSEAMGAWAKIHTEETSEGFVIRTADAIPMEMFGHRVGKHVRANHVRTADDWRSRDDWSKNELRS